MHFLNIDVNLTIGALLQLAFELVNFGALATDNDSRARGLNNDAQLIAGTLNLDRAHASRLQLVFQLVFQPDIFEQKLVVVALHKPARLPRLGVSEPESVWMNLLSHKSPELLLPNRLLGRRFLYDCALLLRRSSSLGCLLFPNHRSQISSAVLSALRQSDLDVRDAAHVTKCPSHRRRTNALHPRPV